MSVAPHLARRQRSTAATLAARVRGRVANGVGRAQPRDAAVESKSSSHAAVETSHAAVESNRMAARRFVAAGLVPGGLLGWELYSYASRKAAGAPTKSAPLVEGSTAWLIEREARTLDLVYTRRKLGPHGPSAALADWCAQRADPDRPYDGVGVVVVERDGAARVLRATVDGRARIDRFRRGGRRRPAKLPTCLVLRQGVTATSRPLADPRPRRRRDVS